MTEVTDASTTGAVGSPLDETLVAHNKALIDRNVALVAERDAAIQRAEDWQSIAQTHLDQLQRALLEGREARAQAALAWEAGRDAAALVVAEGWAENRYQEEIDEALIALTPPADLSAALTARLDAEWNAAIEAAGNLESIHGYSNAVPRHRIRALRRAAPTEGEAQSLDDTTRAVLDRAERIVAGQSQQEQRTAEIFLRPTEGEA